MVREDMSVALLRETEIVWGKKDPEGLECPILDTSQLPTDLLGRKVGENRMREDLVKLLLQR